MLPVNMPPTNVDLLKDLIKMASINKSQKVLCFGVTSTLTYKNKHLFAGSVLELRNASVRDKFLALAAPTYRLQLQRDTCWQRADSIIFEDTPGAVHTMWSVF